MLIAHRAVVPFIAGASAVVAIAVILVADSPREVAGRRGLATWERSCSAAIDGLCVTTRIVVPRDTATSTQLPVQCGPDSERALAVQARSLGDASTARRELGEVIASYERAGGDRREYVQAQLALADDAFERYLELGFPTGLNFDAENTAAKDASVERFAAWLRAKTDLGGQLRLRYEGIAGLGDPAGAVLAMSRMGRIAETFATSLYTADIPEDVRTDEFADDKVEAFCDALTAAAEPLEAQAIEGFAACVTRAREVAKGANVSDLRDIVGAAQPCLDALARMRPDEFPALDEVFQASELTRMQMRIGIVDRPSTGTEYDRANTRGVGLRIQGEVAGARAAYEHAIALDVSRPDAHYNLGLLDELEATRVEPKEAVGYYERASQSFEQAAARATGGLRAEAMDRARFAQKVLRQLQAFLAEL